MPEVSIAKLSPTQIRKMKQGKPFRITSGTATKIYLNDLQYKGFVKNAKTGKSYTIIHETGIQGAGILGDLAGFVHPAAGLLAKAVGLGMRKPRQPKRGKGFLGDIANMALNVGKNLITPEAIKGVLNTGKDYLIQEGTNYAGNKASEFLKDKIGFGMLRNASLKQLKALEYARSMRKARVPKKPKKYGPKRPATMNQLAALAKARAMRGTKKTGSGRKKFYSGSALRVAGSGCY
jgi:hypothetical protein